MPTSPVSTKAAQTVVASAARACLIGGAAVVVAVLSAGSARAASAELDYACDFWMNETSGSGPATAAFDTGLEEGVVVEVDTEVPLSPFTGTITLPEEFTALLRDSGMSSVEGGGESYPIPIAETGDELDSNFRFDETEVPAEGTLTLEVDGDLFFVPEEPGTHTILAGDFWIFLETGDEESDIGVFCELTDEGDTTIDAFMAIADATPTTTLTATATATASPVRPVVVQTDFAEEDASTVPLLGVGALVTLAAGAVGLARGRVRTAARRH